MKNAQNSQQGCGVSSRHGERRRSVALVVDRCEFVFFYRTEIRNDYTRKQRAYRAAPTKLTGAEPSGMNISSTRAWLPTASAFDIHALLSGFAHVSVKTEI